MILGTRPSRGIPHLQQVQTVSGPPQRFKRSSRFSKLLTKMAMVEFRTASSSEDCAGWFGKSMLCDIRTAKHDRNPIEVRSGGDNASCRLRRCATKYRKPPPPCHPRPYPCHRRYPWIADKLGIPAHIHQEVLRLPSRTPPSRTTLASLPRCVMPSPRHTRATSS